MRVRTGVLWLVAWSVPCAGTLTVDDDAPADFASIQAAVDAAVPGVDDVRVRCGTYRENVVMRDGVSVRGAGALCTKLEPARDDAATVEMTALGPDTEWSGFTVLNVPSLSPGSLGIEVVQGSPVITRNVIAGTDSTAYTGPGISVGGGAPVISYNIVRGNYSCCTGGGLLLVETDASVRSNLIFGNASYYGAGILTEGGRPEIVHNTVVENRGWVGGGLLVSNVGDPVSIRGNIVAFNSAVIYGGGLNEWGAVELVDNDFYQNSPEDFAQFDWTGLDGNVSVEPRFVDRDPSSFAGFGLRSSSPLIDAGGSPAGVLLDLRGLPRALDGDADGVSAVDPGARENAGITGLALDGAGLGWHELLAEGVSYDLFRGDLVQLRAGGAYTQDPAVVPGARHFCGLQGGTIDPDLPGEGEGYFYLVAPRGPAVGTLGFRSDLVERPRTLDCIAN